MDSGNTLTTQEISADPRTDSQSTTRSNCRSPSNQFQPSGHDDCNPGSYPISSDKDQLPSYSELRAQEGHRFGRWRGWIEKRAVEREEERNLQRREAELQGRTYGTSWDLPNCQSTIESHNASPNDSEDNYTSTPVYRKPSIISARNENEAFQTGHNPLNHTFTGQSPGLGSSAGLHVEPGPGAVRLTPSTSIYNIGSRFLPQFPSQPLCAIPLPTRANSRIRTGHSIERFLLIGTINGLYVCDLFPSLSNTVKTDLIFSSDSRIYQIWEGLAVHQLEVALEDFQLESNVDGQSHGANPNITPGIVIALTSQNHGSTLNSSSETASKSVKMWPLQSLINLVKFRAFSQSSECLDLREKAPSNKRLSGITGGVSALAGLKSMFEKGKYKAESTFSEIQSSTSYHLEKSESHGSLNGSIKNPRMGQAEYLHRSTRINADGPILFIKLCNSPTPGFNPIRDEIDQKNIEPLPVGLRSRSRPSSSHRDDLGNNYSGWWYLIIATKHFVFVLESQPSQQRTWHLRAEMSAPFTPKAANLVLSEFSKHNGNRGSSSASVANPRPQPAGKRNESPQRGAGEISIFLTMKEYSVAVCLSDLSVRELDLPGSLTTSQTANSGMPRYVTKRLGAGSLNGLPSLDSLSETRLSRTASVHDSDPSSEHILSSRKPKDGAFSMSREDGFLVESRRLSRQMNDRKWIGCEELTLPITHNQSISNFNSEKTGPTARSVYLVTRGYMTYVVLCPLGVETRTKKSYRLSEPISEGYNYSLGPTPSSTLLKPIHTFTWRAIPVRVQAYIVPKPPQWSDRSLEESKNSSKKNEIFCCLTAFTTSGVEVQEGFISLNFARAMWKRQSGKDEEKLHGSFFIPASQYLSLKKDQDYSEQLRSTFEESKTPNKLSFSTTPKSTLMDDGEELSDSSSYDYSASIGFLCASSPSFIKSGCSQDDKVKMDYPESSKGSFFWKEAVGEWKIMYVFNGTELP
ncbi:hypothetical protein BY996DRAFT_6428931 [Phakopsora pachyrhizi]|nr:hypothetical protein BY996DRAFT_6428931 [Phakopsora pachyrhizi]